MSAARRQTRKRPLQRLFYDPWRKLAALVLAVLLWVVLDRQITQSKELVFTLATLESEKVLPPARTGESFIYVRMPPEYSEDVFQDPANNVIDPPQVTLRFEGPAHRIQEIKDSGEQFWVRAELRDGERVFEFDHTRLRGDRELEKALKGMQPVRVKAVFQRNRTRDLPLSHDNLLFSFPSDADDEIYHNRLDLGQAVFTPPTVTLRGTENALRSLDLGAKLFDADLTDLSKWQGRHIKTQLELIPALAGRVSTDVVFVTIPLKPDFKEVTVDVPVLPDLLNTDYELSDLERIPPQRVVLHVSAQLELHLGRTEAERQQWAEKNLRVLVVLPEDATLENLPVVVGRLLFYKEEFKEGKDYRVDAIAVALKPAG